MCYLDRPAHSLSLLSLRLQIMNFFITSIGAYLLSVQTLFTETREGGISWLFKIHSVPDSYVPSGYPYKI